MKIKNKKKKEKTEQHRDKLHVGHASLITDLNGNSFIHFPTFLVWMSAWFGQRPLCFFLGFYCSIKFPFVISWNDVILHPIVLIPVCSDFYRFLFLFFYTYEKEKSTCCSCKPGIEDNTCFRNWYTFNFCMGPVEPFPIQVMSISLSEWSLNWFKLHCFVLD